MENAVRLINSTNDCAKLHCLCRTVCDKFEYYICCDRCDGWFHGKCVGLLESEVFHCEDYICPNCPNSTDTNQASLKLLDCHDYEKLLLLLNSVMGHEDAKPFLTPYDVLEKAKNNKSIRKAIDLTIVEQNVKSYAYVKLAEFIADMGRIFENARYYFPGSSPVYQSADSLEYYLEEKLKFFRQSIMKN